MERRENENENRGIPTVRLSDERVILNDGRNLIFFDFEIAWPEDGDYSEALEKGDMGRV